MASEAALMYCTTIAASHVELTLPVRGSTFAIITEKSRVVENGSVVRIDVTRLLSQDKGIGPVVAVVVGLRRLR